MQRPKLREKMRVKTEEGKPLKSWLILLFRLVNDSAYILKYF
jgi:hypothetical protein